MRLEQLFFFFLVDPVGKLALSRFKLGFQMHLVPSGDQKLSVIEGVSWHFTSMVLQH